MGTIMPRTGKPVRRIKTLPVIGEVDGRTGVALVFRLAVEDIGEDLGGLDRLSRGELELARRAAGLGVMAGLIEADLCNDHEITEEQAARYVSLSNAQGRIFARLGLRRVSRDITPSLDMIRRGEVA